MIKIEEIIEKRQHLITATENLKKHFVGIDAIIDEVISNIEVWYIMPELLTRPVVINLWGMTGVGKTDLIRRLIRELNFEKAYIEVQLDSGKGGAWGRDSIKSHIKQGGLTPEEQGIVFLDEIQRFRSIDENGNMIDNDKFQDIWMLLSDGQFSDYGNQKRELEMMLLEFAYSQDYQDYSDKQNTKKDEETPEDDSEPRATTKKTEPEPFKRRFQTSLWSAQSFKDELEIDMPLEEIMVLTPQDKMKMVQDKIYNIALNNTVRKYSKLLIFISGNLDEAYNMSEDVSEVSIDADILHEFSKKINILNIKDSLLKKFKPEQIARFGNTHIIYPSLSKTSFKQLINRYLSDISKKTLETCDIAVSFDDSVHRAVYRNGVYPTQGTRPLFSTISSLIENPLPTFLFEALLLKKNNIDLSVDDSGQTLNAKIGSKTFRKKINLQIDAIAKKTSPDKLALVATHEAAHAVIYAILLQLAPSQIVSDSNDSLSNGFIIPHGMLFCKDLFLKKIQILLAGGIGEEIVFGKEQKSDGLYKDIQSATQIATVMIRQLNMDDDRIGAMISGGLQDSVGLITDIERTNDKVEQLLKEQQLKVTDLLQNNIEFFKKIISVVLKQKRLLPEDFYKIAKKFVPDIEMQQSDFIKSYTYAEVTESFLKRTAIIAKKNTK